MHVRKRKKMEYTVPEVRGTAKLYVLFRYLKNGRMHPAKVYTLRGWGLHTGATHYDLAAHLAVKLASGWRPSDMPERTQPAAKLADLLPVVLERKRHLKKKVLNEWLRDVARFVVEYGNRTAASIETSDIEAHLATRHVGEWSYNNTRIHLHDFFEILRKMKHTPVNPVSDAERKRTRSKRNVAFRPEALREIMEAARTEHPALHVCLMLMFYAFMRPHEEARLLQGQHFDFSGATIAKPDGNKSSRVHVVPLRPELAEAIRLYIGVRGLNDAEYLFGGAQPVNPSYFKKAWARFAKRHADLIGEHHTMYSVRHTAACMLYSTRKDAEHLRRVMGHGSLSTTLVYLRSLGLFLSSLSPEDMPTL